MSRHSFVRRVGLVTVVLLAFGLPGICQMPEPPPPAAEPAATGEAAEIISVDFKEVPIARAVERIAEATGQNIVVDKDIPDAVSIRLTNVYWEEALKLVAEKAGCIVTRESRNVFRVSKPPRVTMEFRDADLKDSIRLLSLQSGANILVAEDVKGVVNLRLRDVPWRLALDNILKTAGYVLVEDQLGILRVVSPQALQKELETHVFLLTYAYPPANYTAKMESDFIHGKPWAPDMEKIAEDFAVFKAVQSAVSSPGAKVSYIPERNAILVKETAPKIAEIRAIIEKLDVPQDQVFIEVKLVTVSDDVLNRIGVEWLKGLHVANTLFDIPYKYSFKDWVPGEREGKFTFSGGETQAILELLRKDTKTKFIQQPRITALSNNPATIFSGESLHYAETFATVSETGQPTTGIREAARSPVQSGFQLLVVPRVIRGTTKVMLTVVPQATTLTGEGDVVRGLEHFVSGEQAIDLPRLSTNVMVTQVVVESGDTAVLGGLRRVRDDTVVTRVPLLGSIPIAGYLFKHRRHDTINENLLIFITVTAAAEARETLNLISEDGRRLALQ